MTTDPAGRGACPQDGAPCAAAVAARHADRLVAERDGRRRHHRAEVLVDPHQRVERLGDDGRLEPLVAAIDRRIPAPLRQGRTHEVLGGAPLGHALHPPLTDLPIGCWLAAAVLDATGPTRWPAASTTLTAIGIAAALPTAVTGLVEWVHTPHADRGTASLHAACTGTATTCQVVSLAARLAGRRRAGVAVGLLGDLVLTAGAFLGGHLAMGRGVGGGDRSASPS